MTNNTPFPEAGQTSARLFGTDGIRGAFGQAPMDCATLSAAARALVDLLTARGQSNPRIVIGGDTRESTPKIAAWLEAAVIEAGGSVVQVGVLPTPGVAHLVTALAADAGIVVSASHNPFPDNGIKVLDSRGFKLDSETEQELERRIVEILEVDRGDCGGDSRHEASGDVEPSGAIDWKARQHYLDSLIASVVAPSTEASAALAGLSVVLDTGNGAASALAEEVFLRLGARTRVIHDAPDGRNVNQGCGSTEPGAVARAVIELGFDLGFAFDGDADRVIFCDHLGAVRDGDEILFLWAQELARSGDLEPSAIVATSMSNLGLEHALAPLEIDVVRCDVGDREVVSTLRAGGLRLGGEQSGHIIDLERSTTGDGLLTAIQIAHIVCRSRAPAADLLASFERFPQVLFNVVVDNKPPFEQLPRTAEAARSIESELGDRGRLVLRYSGTEPLARIMIEGPELATVEHQARRLADVLEEEIGAGVVHG